MRAGRKEGILIDSCDGHIKSICFHFVKSPFSFFLKYTNPQPPHTHNVHIYAPQFLTQILQMHFNTPLSELHILLLIYLFVNTLRMVSTVLRGCHVIHRGMENKRYQWPHPQ